MRRLFIGTTTVWPSVELGKQVISAYPSPPRTPPPGSWKDTRSWAAGSP